MKSVGVVIQGPLLSFGQGPNNSASGFDVQGTIRANVEQLQQRGLSYVISTWMPSNEREKQVLDGLRDLNVKPLPIPPKFDPDHRYKHHYGIAMAARDMSQDYLVKIRADMLMPSAFWNWVLSSMDDRLIVSELLMPLYLGDFVYAGKKKVLMDFLSTQLAGPNLHPSVTSDIGLRYMVSKTRTQWPGTLSALLFRQKEVISTWNVFIAKHINVVPKDIWNSLVWRGSPIGEVVRSESFRFDASPMVGPMDTRFLLDEYVRYYTKAGDRRRFAARAGVWFYRKAARVKRIGGKLISLRP